MKIRFLDNRYEKVALNWMALKILRDHLQINSDSLIQKGPQLEP